MSINIKVPDETFNFSEITLGEPLSIMNGFYFSHIKHSDDLYIQTPHVSCKSGFVKSGSKHHMDIIFQQNDEKILAWFENLENRIKILIFEKRNEWFNESNIEMSDIENIFISPIRSYRSGKQFTLRSHVESAKSSMINPKEMKIFDMSYNNLSIDDVNNETEFIALLHISGVKFSSRTFQIYTELKQVMIMNKNDIFSSCLIKAPTEDVETEVGKEQDISDIPDTQEGSIMSDTQEKIVIETRQDAQKDGVSDTKEAIEEVVEEVIEESINTHSLKKEIMEATQDTQDTIASNEDVDAQDLQQTSEEVGVQETVDEEDKDNINDFDSNPENNHKNTEIHEFNVNFQSLEDSDIQLQEPELEHIEKYKNAVKKAKELRKEALQTHLEAQNIKAKYLLNVYSDSDSDESIEVGAE
jgi:hypothetical protein